MNFGGALIHRLACGLLAFVVLVLCPRLSVAAAVVAYAQTRWDQLDGLPAPTVHSMAQSTDGRVWIGTEGGLVSYDGFAFRPADGALSEPLGRSVIQTICADPANRVWIGTSALLGVLKDDRIDVATVRMIDGVADAVVALECRSSQRIHFGTQSGGVFALETASGLVRPLRHFGQVVIDIVALDGELLVATQFGGIHRCRESDCVRVPFPPVQIDSMSAGANAAIWVGTRTGELFRVEPDASFRRFVLPPEIAGPIWSIAEDHDRALWIAIHGRGVARMSFDQGALHAAFHTKLHARVARIDRDGSIWVGTSGNGVVRLAPSRFAPPTRGDPLRGLMITAIASAGPSALLLGTYDGALFLADAGEIRVLERSSNDYRRGILSITDSQCGRSYVLRRNNEVWLVERNETMTRIPLSSDPGQLSYQEIAVSPRNNRPMRTDSPCSDRELWLARAQNHLYGREPLTVRERSMPDGTSWRIAEGAHHVQPRSDLETWIATPRPALYLRSRESQLSVPYEGVAASVRVRGVYDDSRGTTWVYFFGGKLGRVVGQSVEAVSFEDLPELHSICAIVEDAEGELYLSSDVGVLRVDPAWRAGGANQAIRYELMDRSDGMRSDVCSGSAVRSPHDGALWFATVDGVAKLPQQAASVASDFPELVIRSIVADGKLVPPGETVVLPPDSRRVDLGFAFVKVAQPAKVRFRHRLAKELGNWTVLRAPGVITYHGLPPGEHEVVIQAARVGSGWRGSEVRQRVVINPRLTDRPAFYALMALTLVLLVSIGYAVRLRGHERRAQESRRRERLARDLHDTVAQGFSGLLMRLQVASHLAPADSPALAEQLSVAYDIAMDNLSELRRVVSDIRSTAGATLAIDAVAMIEHGVRRHVAGTHVTLTFRRSGGSPECLSPFAVDGILRVVHEAVSNALLHSQTTRLEVDVQTSGALLVSVRDHGVGLNACGSSTRAGCGLLGMRHRAEELGGSLEIEHANPGTRIVLRIPLADGTSRG